MSRGDGRVNAASAKRWRGGLLGVGEQPNDGRRRGAGYATSALRGKTWRQCMRLPQTEADRAARGRLDLNPQTHEPNQPVLASAEASTLTISVLVWHSHEFVDRGRYLEI